MCGEPCRASPERENQSQRRAFISPTEKTKETRDIFRTTTLLGFEPSHGNGLLIFFIRISIGLTCVNQEILLQERLQNIPQKLLVFSECPRFFQFGIHKLSHAFQKTSLETPETS